MILISASPSKIKILALPLPPIEPKIQHIVILHYYDHICPKKRSKTKKNLSESNTWQG